MSVGHEPTISFFRLIPAAPNPRRADKSAGGFLPLRGLRYCAPLAAATAYGWWVFPPMGFSLMWDGGLEVLWTPEDSGEWYPLKYAQYPNFAEHFARTAPADLTQFPPPLLASPNEPGFIQVWSGWFARTKPGWSLLVRSPPNFPRHFGLEPFEGVVETDTWFGPLFINLRLTKTDTPVAVRSEFPLMQVTPIFRDHTRDAVLNDVQICEDETAWTEREWDAFRATVAEPHLAASRRRGNHAIITRKRAKQCPHQQPGSATVDAMPVLPAE
jgi:Family of unknown function (DUF6065)